MKILVINAGSSSCKYQLFNMDDQSVLCSGVVERIGQPMGKLSHKIAPGTDKEEKIVVERPFPTHVEGMEDVISLLLDSEKGVIQDKSEISAIGHRVLHGRRSDHRSRAYRRKGKRNHPRLLPPRPAAQPRPT